MGSGLNDFVWSPTEAGRGVRETGRGEDPHNVSGPAEKRKPYVHPGFTRKQPGDESSQIGRRSGQESWQHLYPQAA